MNKNDKEFSIDLNKKILELEEEIGYVFKIRNYLKQQHFINHMHIK